MELKNLVKEIKYLPETLLKKKGLTVIDLNINNEFDKTILYLKYQYKHISDWLAYYLLNCSELYYELVNNKNAGHYKPYAERTVEIHRFAQEVFLLSDRLQKENLQPSFLTYLIEREICLEILDNSGVTGKPKLRGKRYEYDQTIKMCKNFNKPNFKNNEVKKIKTYSERLMTEALEIYKHEENYEFREKYRNFLKLTTKCVELIRKNQQVNFGYLSQGKIITDLRGKHK